jgi:uracil-DNA glycosylase family 4
MDEQVLARLEAWLKYYDDLGIGGFYRSREIEGASLPVPDGGLLRAGMDEAEPAAPAVASAAGKSSGPAAAASRRSGDSMRAGMPAAKAPARPPAQPLPVLGGPSLFETSERIEGDTLDRIRGDIGDCTRCKLHHSRNRIVFGDGHPRARLVFVGEGPGEEEDRQGLPFVGRAGKLLTQMIEAMGLKRENVYIGNVVKCRPPKNRTPEKDEMATCGPFLNRQLAVIGPKVIVCLGNVATQTLLGTSEAMSRLRGRWFDYHGAKLLPTYHPAYLLRNPNAKGVVWEDLQTVMAELGLELPKKKPAARK